MQRVLMCIQCWEIFSRHKHITECPFCGGALVIEIKADAQDNQ